ncbi:MAG: ABC transporter ATP-binding protein [Trueperaceae bacterium]|nr:MAG: ABC transporter ATP-binding protein [Trueperaceae bacterium]
MSLRAEALSFSYGERPVLREVAFVLEAGELVGVVGPNGAGKSTLIDLLTRVRAPGSGRVSLDGVPLSKLSRLELARKIAVVPQAVSLPHAFSVGDIVMMGRTPHLGFLAPESDEDREIVGAAMRTTDVWEFRDRLVGNLSGGERQRVAFARALAQQPRYLLLDEPTAHLDLRYQVEVLRYARDATRRGLGALLVLHDLNLCARVCDRVVVLSEGVVVANGLPRTVVSEQLLKQVYGPDVRVLDALDPDGHPIVLPTV